jgi:hypothetical protein
MNTEETAEKQTYKELAKMRAEQRGEAEETVEESTEEKESPAEETERTEETVVATAAESEEEKTAEKKSSGAIKIGDHFFDSAEDAMKYAEKLENEKLIAEAANQAIRETLQYVRQPEAAALVPEEDLEQEFYANPKEALTKVQKRARDEALSVIRQENEKERLWMKFCDQYPDLAGSRSLIEQIVSTDPVIAKMTDVDSGFKLLARKARSFYQEYIDRTKPRTELPNKSGQVVSSGMSSPSKVTPKKSEEAPIDFISQLKRMRR